MNRKALVASLGSVFLMLGAAASCVVDEIDFSAKGCPCPQPLVCDAKRNRCVTALADQEGGGGPDGAVECPSGFGDCDGDRANGCETDLTKTIGHCGRCGNVCAGAASAFPVCRDSKCELGCNVGAGDCDGDPSNGCETNTSQSTKHCGGCNHDCLGTACTNGFCEATAVASGLDTPTGIALDATHVYWRARTSLQRIPKVGGAVQTLTSATSDPYAAPVIDGTSNRVYFVDGQNILACPTTTAACTPRLIGTVNNPLVLGLDDENLWVTDGALNNSRLHFVARGGGDDAGLAVRDGGVGMGFNLGPTSAALYWVRLNGVLVALRKTESRVTTLSTAPATLTASFGIAVAADQVFFTAYNANDANALGAVYQCKTMGCAVPTEFMPAISAPFGVAVDGDYVYAVAQGTTGNQNADGKVLRCPVQGCETSGPTPLAINQKLASYLATDATHVYWVTETQIMRVAK